MYKVLLKGKATSVGRGGPYGCEMLKDLTLSRPVVPKLFQLAAHLQV
jgi:hypothetical protein